MVKISKIKITNCKSGVGLAVLIRSLARYLSEPHSTQSSLKGFWVCLGPHICSRQKQMKSNWYQVTLITLLRHRCLSWRVTLQSRFAFAGYHVLTRYGTDFNLFFMSLVNIYTHRKGKMEPRLKNPGVFFEGFLGQIGSGLGLFLEPFLTVKCSACEVRHKIFRLRIQKKPQIQPFLLFCFPLQEKQNLQVIFNNSFYSVKPFHFL